MPPDGVATALAVLLVAGAGYAEWVAWAPPSNERSTHRATRWETLAVHAAALLQLALAAIFIVAA